MPAASATSSGGPNTMIAVPNVSAVGTISRRSYESAIRPRHTSSGTAPSPKATSANSRDPASARTPDDGDVVARAGMLRRLAMRRHAEAPPVGVTVGRVAAAGAPATSPRADPRPAALTRAGSPRQAAAQPGAWPRRQRRCWDGRRPRRLRRAGGRADAASAPASADSGRTGVAVLLSRRGSSAESSRNRPPAVPTAAAPLEARRTRRRRGRLSGRRHRARPRPAPAARCDCALRRATTLVRSSCGSEPGASDPAPAAGSIFSVLAASRRAIASSSALACPRQRPAEAAPIAPHRGRPGTSRRGGRS